MVVLDLDVQIDVPGIGGVLFIWVVIGRHYPPSGLNNTTRGSPMVRILRQSPKLFVEEINVALDESVINMSIAKSAVDIIWMHYRFTALIIMLHIVLHKGSAQICNLNRSCILKIILIYLTILFSQIFFFWWNEEAYGYHE